MTSPDMPGPALLGLTVIATVVAFVAVYFADWFERRFNWFDRSNPDQPQPDRWEP